MKFKFSIFLNHLCYLTHDQIFFQEFYNVISYIYMYDHFELIFVVCMRDVRIQIHHFSI